MATHRGESQPRAAVPHSQAGEVRYFGMGLRGLSLAAMFLAVYGSISISAVLSDRLGESALRDRYTSALNNDLGLPGSIERVENGDLTHRNLYGVTVHRPDDGSLALEVPEARVDEEPDGGRIFTAINAKLTLGDGKWLASVRWPKNPPKPLREVRSIDGTLIIEQRLGAGPALRLVMEGVDGVFDFRDDQRITASITAARVNGLEMDPPLQVTARMTRKPKFAIDELRFHLRPTMPWELVRRTLPVPDFIRRAGFSGELVIRKPAGSDEPVIELANLRVRIPSGGLSLPWPSPSAQTLSPSQHHDPSEGELTVASAVWDRTGLTVRGVAAALRGCEARPLAASIPLMDRWTGSARLSIAALRLDRDLRSVEIDGVRVEADTLDGSLAAKVDRARVQAAPQAGGWGGSLEVAAVRSTPVGAVDAEGSEPAHVTRVEWLAAAQGRFRVSVDPPAPAAWFGALHRPFAGLTHGRVGGWMELSTPEIGRRQVDFSADARGLSAVELGKLIGSTLPDALLDANVRSGRLVDGLIRSIDAEATASMALDATTTVRLTLGAAATFDQAAGTADWNKGKLKLTRAAGGGAAAEMEWTEITGDAKWTGPRHWIARARLGAVGGAPSAEAPTIRARMPSSPTAESVIHVFADSVPLASAAGVLNLPARLLREARLHAFEADLYNDAHGPAAVFKGSVRGIELADVAAAAGVSLPEGRAEATVTWGHLSQGSLKSVAGTVKAALGTADNPRGRMSADIRREEKPQGAVITGSLEAVALDLSLLREFTATPAMRGTASVKVADVRIEGDRLVSAKASVSGELADTAALLKHLGAEPLSAKLTVDRVAAELKDGRVIGASAAGRLSGIDLAAVSAAADLGRIDGRADAAVHELKWSPGKLESARLEVLETPGYKGSRAVSDAALKKIVELAGIRLPFALGSATLEDLGATITRKSDHWLIEGTGRAGSAAYLKLGRFPSPVVLPESVRKRDASEFARLEKLLDDALRGLDVNTLVRQAIPK